MKTEEIVAASGETNSAVMADRMRVAAIIESPLGKRNPAMATKLALYTSLDTETALSILADAPPANPYTAAMDQLGPTGVNGAKPADFSAPDPKAARLKEISVNVAAFNAARRGKRD